MTTIGVETDGVAFTVVIPTRGASGHVDVLLDRLAEALPVRPGQPAPRLLLVDDSTGRTAAAIRSAARDCPLPVTVLHRDGPVGGQGGAVTEGLRAAEGEWAVVMDPALRHPPQLVPELVAAGRAAGADLAVATRFGSGGHRRVAMRSSRLLAKLLFARELRRISDPMSDFFALRRDAVDLAGLSPRGYQVLLELAVRARPRLVVEVPYRFAAEPSTGLLDGLRFLGRLAGLRLSTPVGRAIAFGLVGLSGLLPNLLALEVLTGLGLHYLPAAVLANQAGIAWNFALLERTVYRHRRHRHWADRSLRFVGVCNLDLLLRIPLMAWMVSGLGIGPAAATVLALVVSSLLRFLFAERAIYLPAPLRSRPRTRKE